MEFYSFRSDLGARFPEMGIKNPSSSGPLKDFAEPDRQGFLGLIA
jgi:hypothetical protein